MLQVSPPGFEGPRPWILERVSLPASLDVLVLAPHPDDFDAIAVSMRFLHLQGHRIHVAVLTTGVSGVEDGFGGAVSDAGKAAIREQEQRASCALFGLPRERLAFLRLDEDERGHQRDDDVNRARVRTCLLERRPALVFMPHGNDSNIAHQRTYAMFRSAVEDTRLPLWACLNRDAKTLSMRADLVMPFDAEGADWKRRLLRAHASQQERNIRTRGYGFDERVLRVNRDAAGDAGIVEAYAEVFELERYGA